MKRNVIVVAAVAWVMLLTLGCTPILRPTRLPEFIEKLDRHHFTNEEKRTLGEILHYINELENDAH